MTTPSQKIKKETVTAHNNPVVQLDLRMNLLHQCIQSQPKKRVTITKVLPLPNNFFANPIVKCIECENLKEMVLEKLCTYVSCEDNYE